MASKIYWLFASKDELVALGVNPHSIYENITDEPLHDNLTQCELTEEQALALIPKDTMYCYHPATKGRGVPCPFWDVIRQFPKQSNGYCHYLKKGDEALGGGLLWDQCKECGKNLEPDDII